MRRVIFLALCCAKITNCYAQQAYCQQKKSKLVCGYGELEYMNHLGELQLQGTQIKKMLHVTGDLDAENAVLARTSILGSAIFRQSNLVGKVSVTGESKLIDSTVSQQIELTGNAYFINNHFVKHLNIKGEMYSKNNWYQAKTSVQGMLQSEHDHFEQALDVQACHLELNETRAKGIKILHQTNCLNNRQYLVLKGRSQIDGDIVFQGSGGEVWLGTEAKIKGKVVGGNLKQISKKQKEV